ncbi:tetratricopeptide repeat protein [Streptomyces nigrescens]
MHALLSSAERGPILVLATLWPEYATQYTDLPASGKGDVYSRVQELLAGRTVSVPSAFDDEALHEAASLADAGDEFLTDALSRARIDGQVTQDLAGAPELLRRYEYSTPAARAVLSAAMDARRLGVGSQLPQAFLIEASIGYLTDQEYDELTDDWVESAFAELARPVHGKLAALRRIGSRPKRHIPGRMPPVATPAPMVGPFFRLADYLEQHGRMSRRNLTPPASFWESAYAHLTNPDDLSNLATAAQSLHRPEWAHRLHHRAADTGDSSALSYLARMREEGEDRSHTQDAAEVRAENSRVFGGRSVTSGGSVGVAVSGDYSRVLIEEASVLQEALALGRHIHGDAHPDTLRTSNNLATAYQASGDVGRAISLLESTLALSERVLGDAHPDSLTSRNNLAYAYRASGDVGRAISLLESTLALSERVLGDAHPDTLRTSNNLAIAYRAVGDVGRAIPLLESTLALSEQVFGDAHPDTLRTSNNLATAYQAVGDVQRAISLLERTVDLSEKVQSGRYPDALTSRKNLAALYELVGRSEDLRRSRTPAGEGES